MINKYENVLLGDLNVDLFDSTKEDSNYLSDHLTNLIKEDTCFNFQKGSVVDISPTNIPKSF